eukprot:TRINITY_DN77364_c0_g1_i1.p2 TRINITY_DN77364_c0_g1~~TRINITY_DN77364_c0_g1_i1.p2  ORF type:complete len:205 (-),score=6.93 TRINITY_DN77364_c0_g1_i1:139-753(-)
MDFFEKLKDGVDDVAQKVRDGKDKVAVSVGLQAAEPVVPQEQSMLEDWQGTCSLSKKQRIVGAIGSAAGGLLFLFLSSLLLPTIALMPTKFAFFFTFGNIFLLSSTMFIVGPMAQIRSMCDESRRFSSAVYVLALCGTLFSAIKIGSTFLTITFMILQLISLFWYVTSYLSGLLKWFGSAWTAMKTAMRFGSSGASMAANALPV